VRIYRYTSNRGGLQPRIAVAAEDNPPCDLIDAWHELEGEGVRDDSVMRLDRSDDPSIPSWMLSVTSMIELGSELWTQIEDLARRASAKPNLTIKESEWEVGWLCPLDRLESLRDFLSFESHVKRGAERRGGEVPPYWYEAPVYYKGNHRSALGPDELCPWPSYTSMLDFELELAMVVGLRGRNIPVEDAGRHIFGYTVMNDFSARDIQANEITTWLGPAKGKDFATSFGPCIVTATELGATPDLQMTCRVNGEEWGSGRSSEMHWSWEQILVHVSRDEDVFAADVYGSGTPGGCCGLDLGRSVEPGDVVELEIEKIGVLRNRIGPR
jgi:2-keto-4-pentenoate hydratase/2-oxohepta-3-ene-1,7-dioic acid hydratase in catechol pathway